MLNGKIKLKGLENTTAAVSIKKADKSIFNDRQVSGQCTKVENAHSVAEQCEIQHTLPDTYLKKS